MAKETKKIIVFADGTEMEVTAEDGKYWMCGAKKFRKMNPAIDRIREEAIPKKKKKAVEEPVVEEEEITVEAESPVEFAEGFDNIPSDVEF